MPQNPLASNQSPDLPDVLLHMTGRAGRRVDSLNPAVLAMTPDDRLASILMTRQLHFTPPFDGDWPVVCWSQSTRTALSALTGYRYAAPGIALHKQAVWDKGGGPALYVRGDEYEAFRGAVPPRLRARGPKQ